MIDLVEMIFQRVVDSGADKSKKGRLTGLVEVLKKYQLLKKYHER